MAAAKKDDAKKAAEAALPAPIIIKKVQGDEAAGHGGAWKIALADMMTAMMAFFLLMWLLGATSEAKRKSIADYFKPTPKSLIQSGQMAGSNGILGGRSIMDPEGMPNAASQTSVLDLEPPRDPTDANDDGKGSEKDKDAGKGPQKTEFAGNGPDAQSNAGKGPDAQDKAGKGPTADQLTEEQKQKIAQEQDDKNFAKLETDLKEKMMANSALANLAGQVSIVREKEGLRIEVIDKADFSMFGLGTTKLAPKSQALIDEISKSVAGMSNKVTIRGHTDSIPFANAGAGKNNWMLSAERADITRQMLEKNGVASDRVMKIEGVADTDPFNPADKSDPRNRRISITLHYTGG